LNFKALSSHCCGWMTAGTTCSLISSDRLQTGLSAVGGRVTFLELDHDTDSTQTCKLKLLTSLRERILQRMLYALAKSPPFASSSSRFLVSDVSALCLVLRESLVNFPLFGHRVALLAGLSRQTSAPLTNSPPFASSSNRFLGWTLLILH
jgi:hypothetical protein